MIRSLAALALGLAPLAGCASDNAQAAKPAPTAQKASTDDPKAVCVATMTRSRECTDDYIPALVDARAQADAPPGIADAVKKDRNAVIAEAKQEWATDSQDANIAGMCEKMAGDPPTSSAWTWKPSRPPFVRTSRTSRRCSGK